MVGLTRIRNEELIIEDTLNHLSEFCERIYIFDDASEDGTVGICKAHPNVVEVLQAPSWDADQMWVQGAQRYELFEHAKSHESDNWYVYIDADERLDVDPQFLRSDNSELQGYSAVVMLLLDFYLTPDDHAPYQRGADLKELRQWVGSESRDILIAFTRQARYPEVGGYRMPRVPGPALKRGFVRHYGKAISVQQFEETCDYYAQYVPNLASKWAARKGKAIHTVPDFGRQLLSYEDAKQLLGQEFF